MSAAPSIELGLNGWIPRGVRLALFGKWEAGGTRARGSNDEDEGTVLVDIMAETHVTRIGWRKASRSNIVLSLQEYKFGPSSDRAEDDRSRRAGGPNLPRRVPS